MAIPAGKPPGRGSIFCYLKVFLVVRETKMWCIKFTSKTAWALAGLA